MNEFTVNEGERKFEKTVEFFRPFSINRVGDNIAVAEFAENKVMMIFLLLTVNLCFKTSE